MSIKPGAGYIERFDPETRELVRVPVRHGIFAKADARMRKVEAVLEAGGAQHFIWLTPEEARRLAADLVAAADLIEGRVGARSWVHQKRGTTYDEVMRGELQASRPVEEGERLIGYVGADGRGWFRPVEEFEDGRFIEGPRAPDVPQSG